MLGEKLLDENNKLQVKAIRIMGLLALLGLSYAFIKQNFILAVLIVLIPCGLILLKYILDKPITLLYVIFASNYFLLAGNRYVNLSGISLYIDALLISELIVIIIHSVTVQDIEWKNAYTTLTITTLIWMAYCIFEVINPTGVFEGWFRSRIITYGGFVLSIITALVVTKFKQVRVIVILYAIFTFLAVLKAFMQKFIGFDSGELRWLNNGGAVTHIIASGTRYFSFFTDAGNFGSNMGCAASVLLIIAFNSKSVIEKIIYIIIGLSAIYAMFLSGTRGAMIVPLGALAMLTLTSKKVVAVTLSGVLLLSIYIFFAFTNIGNSNSMVRRMRSSFRPSEDASFNVRKMNQAKLSPYLKSKPFGEGLGLSGTENQDISYRFTTTIPNDSWYVKLWVETGIIGLIIYLTGFIIVLLNCIYVVMFKIKTKKYKDIATAFLCGVFGLLLSAYGNPFFGQYPTMFIAIIFLAICIKMPTIEANDAEANNEQLIKN